MVKKFNASQLMQIQSEFGLDQKEIGKLTQSQTISLQRKLDKRDRPRARAAFARLFECDDHGDIPENAVDNALRQLDSSRARAQSKPMVAGVPCGKAVACLLYTSPSPRDRQKSRMPSSA